MSTSFENKQKIKLRHDKPAKVPKPVWKHENLKEILILKLVYNMVICPRNAGTRNNKVGLRCNSRE